MISEIIDKNTADLLKDLESDFNISFVTKDIAHCEVFCQNDNATVTYNPRHVTSASIAHELLHVWLKRFNYSIGNRLFMITRSDGKLSKIISKQLCEHIGNCFDHLKMYPRFLEMGYNAKQFLTNGLEPKCSLADIVGLNFYAAGRYNGRAVDRYMGSLIAILADHVPTNDYSKHHAQLEMMDAELYGIVTRFWNSWVQFDISKIDPIWNSDFDFTDNLVSDLNVWVGEKNILLM